jgi:acetyl esterase/lipase
VLVRYLRAGYTVVSIDYRLAPESKLPSSVEDLEDALLWIRREGPGLFAADVDRIAVVGHSAGGFMTLLAGFRVNPRPRALVSFYGYGDIIGDWLSKPDPFYCRQPAPSLDEVKEFVGGEVISHSRLPRGAFYLHCRQNGLWSKEITGFDPETEADAYVPFLSVRNVTADYPPTLLMHGDDDTDVPCAQSIMMAEALQRAGVKHELRIYPGAGHGFDVSKEYKKDAYDRTFAFLSQHMG